MTSLQTCVEIRTMEKTGNGMALVEVGSTSCFSNETLYRRLQSFEKVHHTLKQLADLNYRGYGGITGKDFQMTTLPTLRASEVPFNCSAGWISCFCSPDPSSLTLLCTRVNYITRLPCPPFSGCLQPTGGSGMTLWGRGE